MSSLLNPEAHNEPTQQHAMSQGAAPAASDVTASLIKFWDTVRSSAELIVTLRQEVVQLRAQNSRLETELTLANEQASIASASNETIEMLEMQILELTEQSERYKAQFEQETLLRNQDAEAAHAAAAQASSVIGGLQSALLETQAMVESLERRVEELSEQGEQARREHEQQRAVQQEELARAGASAQEMVKLQEDLSQVRMELCEYELQVSARESELRAVKDEMALLQAQYEDLVERQSQATLADLAALNEVHEKRLAEAQLEAAEVRQTMERMKTEKSQLNDDYLMLAEKYQSIEVQVANMQRALSEAQDALQQAHTRMPQAEAMPAVSSPELDALQHRLSELELIATKAAETEERMAVLQEEIESLQEQLERAMGIVELYRAAGLRHIEDPDLRNQMSLFAMPVASEDSRQIIEEQTSGKGLTPEEMEALADRLDNLANRVAHLLGIS